jgi:hypothetical protein
MKLNLCTSIHSPEILQILNAIPPENYLKLGGTLRTKLLFRIQELPPEKYFHSRRFIRNLPLFEMETGERPDFLVNLAARVIWDNIDKYFGIDPELVNQVVSYGQLRFVAATNSMAILPPGVPVTAINKEFIAYNPNLTKLYNKLEIEILNWATYFRHCDTWIWQTFVRPKICTNEFCVD